MKFCDENGFGPFIKNGSFISPCFSQIILEPILYLIFIIFAYKHYKSLTNLPYVLDFRHSSLKFKLKLFFSALQTAYPIILTFYILFIAPSPLRSYARLISYFLRHICWTVSTILVIFEYQKALRQHQNVRLMWIFQLFIDFFACFVPHTPHDDNYEVFSTLLVVNFLLSAGLCGLSIWNDEIKFSLFVKNKDNESNYFWNDFHDNRSRSRSRTRSTTPDKGDREKEQEEGESYLVYGLEKNSITFDNLKT